MIRANHNIALIALLIATGVLTGAAKPAPSRFIPADALDITTFLPAPPAADLPEARAELGVVLRAQYDASDAEKARAKSEKKLNLAAFTPVVGSWFTAENLPQTKALLKQLEADSKVFTDRGKDYFKRVRPCDADKHVVDLAQEEEQEYSYPSGHSTRGTLYAAVLAQVLPELKDQLLARGQEIGWDRIIAGVHYPSDIVAGRVLGQALAKAALANPLFKTELEQVRAEIAAAKQKAATAAPANVSH